MRILVLFIASSVAMVNCQRDSYHNVSKSGIEANLGVAIMEDADSGCSAKLTVKVINSRDENVFLTDDFNLKVLREDSLGNYIDFTKSWLISEASIYKSEQENNFGIDKKILIQPLIDSVVSQIFKEHKEIKHEWEIRDQVEIAYNSLLFLPEGQSYRRSISLKSLLIKGGRYKLIYHYKSYLVKYFEESGFEIKIPETIKGYNKYQFDVVSDTLYINFD